LKTYALYCPASGRSFPILTYLSAPKKRTMTTRLLLAAALVFCGTAASAQWTNAPDYRINVGINGGLAPTTRIYREVDYSADEKSLPNMFGIVGNYNYTDRFQLGLEINRSSEWSSRGVVTLNGLNGTVLGQPGVRYVYAERSWTLQARVNGVIPIYDQMRSLKADFYYGLGLGAVFTVNDGRTVYNQFNDGVGQEYRFVSEYHYEPAAGYTVGVQAGMDWWFLGRLGVNAEVAPRFTHLNLVDNRAASRNGPFDLISFPMTVGLRYRFGTSGWAH